ncbi:MAG: AAA family ATPase [Candidatus Saccharimonadaceae bacterium]
MKPLTSASPHAIVMIGIPGSGKSSFADRFADTFQAPIVSQTKFQRDFGLSVVAAEELRNIILAEYMKTHRTVLIDGGLNGKEKREELVRRLVKAGYRPLIIWVQTDTSEAHRRAIKPYPRGSGISEEEFDTLLNEFEAPGDKEKMVVISGKHTYASQLKIILKQLATPDNSQPVVPLSPEQKKAATKIVVDNHSRNRGTFLR